MVSFEVFSLDDLYYCHKECLYISSVCYEDKDIGKCVNEGMDKAIELSQSNYGIPVELIVRDYSLNEYVYEALYKDGHLIFVSNKITNI